MRSALGTIGKQQFGRCSDNEELPSESLSLYKFIERGFWNCLFAILSRGPLITYCELHVDRLCGLVVRVLGYRSGGSGSIPGTTKKN
jgi:hypothetical protein